MQEEKPQTPCPQCGELFVSVKNHLPHCKGPENANQDERTKTPCPQCGKLTVCMEKHLPRCQKVPSLPLEATPSPPLEEIRDHMLKHGELLDLKEKLRLRRRLTNSGARSVNQIIDGIEKEVKRHDKLKWTFLNTGSSYEGVKINAADEYDCMVVARVDCQADFSVGDIDPIYCVVRVDNGDKLPDPDRQLMVKGIADRLLSPKAFKGHLRKYVVQAVEGLREKKRRIEITDPDSGPSIQLTIKEYQGPEGPDNAYYDMDVVPSIEMAGWPEPAKSWKSSWLPEYVQKQIKQRYHVTPKIHPSERPVPADQTRYWRLSFSAAEKEIIKHADGSHGKDKDNDKQDTCGHDKKKQDTCRKDVLKILKHFNEELDKQRQPGEEKAFCSYHLKTLMLREFEKPGLTENEAWTLDQLSIRVLGALRSLIQHLREKSLPHYFVPEVNILQDLGDPEAATLVRYFQSKLDYYSGRAGEPV